MQILPVYTDFQSIAALRSEQGGSESERLVSVAEQFSAVFTQMMLKSMRQASLGEGIFDSQQSEFYRDMFDKQLALELSQGERMGISSVLVSQLQQMSGVENGDVATAGLNQAAVYSDIQQRTDPGQSRHLDRAQDRLEPADKRDSRNTHWIGRHP